MFDQGRSTFGSYKMFASLTVSMAFHLIRLKVTLRRELKYFKLGRGKIFYIRTALRLTGWSRPAEMRAWYCDPRASSGEGERYCNTQCQLSNQISPNPSFIREACLSTEVNSAGWV